MTIADQMAQTRFQTLDRTATGDVRTSYSDENVNSPNVAEPSPLNFYQRVFGADYQDPNAPSFTPNPRVMVRKSVLSGVLDETRELDGRRRRPRTARASTSTSPGCATSRTSSTCS